MERLRIFLPPFASDYSGVCSALFDLRCLTAINDASCCTSHYVYYDEPRWSREVRPVLCTMLRNADAIMGADDKVIAQVRDIAGRIDAPVIAVVGTPVPAIIGMDMAGIAREIEALTGRPCLGFDTTGFDWYDKGVVMAGRALVDRFASGRAAAGKIAANRVNIIGTTPLDFGDVGNDADLTALLEGNGMEVGARFFMGLSVEQVARCGEAALNLAVSSAGVALADCLKRRFGTPYVAGLPVGGPQTAAWLETVENALAGQEAGKPAGGDGATGGRARACGPADDPAGGRVLIVADQVAGNSWRERLRLEGESRPIDVASFFSFHAALARPGDTRLDGEASYLRLLGTGRYGTLVADPLIGDVPPASGMERVELVHPAVSGKLCWDRMTRFLGPDGGGSPAYRPRSTAIATTGLPGTPRPRTKAAGRGAR